MGGILYRKALAVFLETSRLLTVAAREIRTRTELHHFGSKERGLTVKIFE